MNPCAHTGWLRVSGKEHTHLHYANRMSDVVREMENPEHQYPSTVFLVGRPAKDAALRQIFPNNNIRRGRTDSVVDLRSDSATIASDFPILFADGDPLIRTPSTLAEFPCHQNQSFPVQWQMPRGLAIGQVLFARLIALFSDVVCVFADDFTSMQDLANFLTAWVNLGSPSDLPLSLRPRLVVVASEDSASATSDVLDAEDLRLAFPASDDERRSQVFASISLLQISGDRISPLARHRRLKEVLLTELDIARRNRIETRMLFSALHLSALVKRAIEHVAKSFTEVFSFIWSTRIENPIGGEYPAHLCTFFNLAEEHRIAYGKFARFVASTIIMDAYPPRMHGFPAVLLFRRLYERHVFRALLKVFGSFKLARTLCTAIEDHVSYLAASTNLNSEATAAVHASNLRKESTLWTRLRSHRTCLFCLRRAPEYILTCEHAICEICAMRFGSRMTGKAGHFQVSHCILCVTKGTATVKIKPRTADVRIISVDGGGIGGIVPLEYLCLLQRVLGPDLPVRDLFDEAFGTSSGGLIVIGLFLKCWDIDICIRTFDQLVREFFGVHLTSRQSLLTRVRNYFRCWLSDGCYDVDALENSLKEAFGDEGRMFGVPSSGVSGSKVAVTTTTISDAFTYIFTNYNGRLGRAKDCGYKVSRPEKIENEVLLWQAGRATSAAPVLFKPAHINSLGAFQDGALKHNNPVNLAVSECRNIWTTSTSADVVLSLGTGTKNDLQSPKAPTFRHVINDGFIPRLFRCLMSSMDGEQTWRDAINRLDETARKKYFRLNVQFHGEEPRLDDVGRIEELRRSVHWQPAHAVDLTSIALALVASSFYFELTTVPQFQAGRYLCRGSVRCRNDCNSIFVAIRRMCSTQPELQLPGLDLGAVEEAGLCGTCREYCKMIEFHVRSLDDPVDLSLHFGKRGNRRISGFPRSMTWFVEQQQLDVPFGTLWHDARFSPPCDACDTLSHTRATPLNLQRKRRADHTSPSGRPRKRPRMRVRIA